jgi:hypothetical protein
MVHDSIVDHGRGSRLSIDLQIAVGVSDYERFDFCLPFRRIGN